MILLSARAGETGGMSMPGQFSCLTDKDMSDATFVTMCLFSNLACMPCSRVFFSFCLFLGQTQIQYACVAFDTKEKTQEENCHPVAKPESRLEDCNLSPCPPR